MIKREQLDSIMEREYSKINFCNAPRIYFLPPRNWRSQRAGDQNNSSLLAKCSRAWMGSYKRGRFNEAWLRRFKNIEVIHEMIRENMFYRR